MSEGLRYIPVCVQEAICEPASTACTGSSQRPTTSATLEELESCNLAAWDPERCVPLRAGLAGTGPAWKLEDQHGMKLTRDDYLLQLVDCLESSTLIDHLLKDNPNSAIDWIPSPGCLGATYEARWTWRSHAAGTSVCSWQCVWRRAVLLQTSV